MFSEQIKTKNHLPNALYSAQQVKEFEGEAAQLAETTLYELMKRAGTACYQVFKKHFPVAQHVLVLTGKGNNGGDGYVFALLAKNAGLSVQLCQIGDPAALTGDAAQARDAWQIGQGEIAGIEQADFAAADVIVDALLGTGFSGALRAPYQHLIYKINQANKAVLSVDIPSGMNADSGAVSDVAI